MVSAKPGDAEEAQGDMSCFVSTLATDEREVAFCAGSMGEIGTVPGAEANFLLETLYSQVMAFSTHRLHWGYSPEHLVLWE